MKSCSKEKMEELESESIIENLCEAHLIRTKNMLKMYNAKDIADLIFLYFILLTILKKDFNSTSVASGYAKHTIRFGGWDSWRFSYNDLGVLIHTLFGEKNQTEELRDKDLNKIFMKKVRFNQRDAIIWLRDVVRGIDRTNRDRRFLLELERDLQIDNSNYRSVRRLASEWKDLNHGERSLVITRLLHAFRVRARKSELLGVLEAFAKVNKLEIKNSNNPEEDVSDQSASIIKKAAATAGIIGATAGAAMGFSAWRAKKRDEQRRATYSKKVGPGLEESTGTTSGAIATVVAPLFSEPVSRIPKKKKKKRI